MAIPEHDLPPGFPCGKTFLLPGPAGALELVTSCVDDEKAVPATVVICHPHPIQGGTMHNKVVHTLAKSFGDLGLRTVRFNFRGIGASEGTFDHGRGETEDALAVLSWVRAQQPDDEIWLAGFSFGGFVAANAAHTFKVAQLVTVAPAVHLYNFASIKKPPAPWLVVQGDADEVVAPQDVLDWSARMHPPPQLVMLESVGHFFHGRLHDLRHTIHSQLSRHVPRP